MRRPVSRGRRRHRDAAARGAAYPDWPKVEQFYSTLLEDVRRQPGVDSRRRVNASCRWSPAGACRYGSKDVRRPRRWRPSRSTSPSAAATSKAFRARLVAGTVLPRNRHDDRRAGGRRQRDVREAGVPGEDAVGRSGSCRPRNRSVRSDAMRPRRGRGSLPHRRGRRRHSPGADRPGAEPVIYHTHRQFPFRAMTLVARGADTATVVSGLRAALRALDPRCRSATSRRWRSGW